MHAAGVDVLVCCGQNNVSYTTGSRVPAADHVRAGWWRSVAIFERDAEAPHVYTAFPEGVPADLPAEFVHDALAVENARRRGGVGRPAAFGRARHRRLSVSPVDGAARRRSRAARRERGVGAREVDENARRARVHSSGAGDQRAGDARGAPARGGRREGDRPVGRVPARRRRARRDGEHRRSRVPSDARVGRRRRVLGDGRGRLPLADPTTGAA